jgi:hypothetical protein
MNFYIPTDGPSSWQALLGDPVKHWKMGRSARTLAYCWESAKGFPSEISSVLDASPYDDLHDLEFVAAFPEHKVSLPGRGGASQTDVLVLATGSAGLASIAIEGKVDESFDKSVEVWFDSKPSADKRMRLAYLCDLLGITTDDAMMLRYQLLHRTASAIIEATRFKAGPAVMLVHSWAPNLEGFDDYSEFVNSLGGSPEVGSVTRVTTANDLFIGWVRGEPEWLAR